MVDILSRKVNLIILWILREVLYCFFLFKVWERFGISNVFIVDIIIKGIVIKVIVILLYLLIIFKVLVCEKFVIIKCLGMSKVVRVFKILVKKLFIYSGMYMIIILKRSWKLFLGFLLDGGILFIEYL